ncbi:uncharacterized protein [Anabrus simplex]|uniref:uncharacterized protein n=1 Tax=Anabrus simplex TaxID=316456 RepID=UPI0035A38EC7
MQGRRGTLYHISSQAALKHQASVSELKAIKRFSSTNFATSAAGILKIVVIVVFLIAAAVFLAASTDCSSPVWWFFPLIAFVIIIVMCIMYALFMLGYAEDNINLWVKLDLGLLTLAIIFTIVISILTFTMCNGKDTASYVPGPLGLIGALLLAVNAAAMYVMWRYREEEPPVATDPATVEQRQPARKSVYV